MTSMSRIGRAGSEIRCIHHSHLLMSLVPIVRKLIIIPHTMHTPSLPEKRLTSQEAYHPPVSQEEGMVPAPSLLLHPSIPQYGTVRASAISVSYFTPFQSPSD